MAYSIRVSQYIFENTSYPCCGLFMSLIIFQRIFYSWFIGPQSYGICDRLLSMGLSRGMNPDHCNLS